MPVATTYPGVYVEEIPSGVRTITGVATSVTAFIGRAPKGPLDEPVSINSLADFVRVFGGVSENYPTTYAVEDFFVNGGAKALVVRVFKSSTAGKDGRAVLAFGGAEEASALRLTAVSPGAWANKLRAEVDKDFGNLSDDDLKARFGVAKDDLFNLTFIMLNPDGTDGDKERIRNVTVKAGSRRVDRVLELESRWFRIPEDQLKTILNGDGSLNASIPSATPRNEDGSVKKDKRAQTTEVSDSAALTGDDLLGNPAKKTGMYALKKADVFNLLCIPPDTRDDDVTGILGKALQFCVEQRAILIVDPPKAALAAEFDAQKSRAAIDNLGINGTNARNAAVFFPRIRKADSQREGQIDTFVPCGAVAGVIARTDVQRGVWKSSAGIDAGIAGIEGPSVPMNDEENGELNPFGINCLRSFPVIGNVVWGARTMRGADQLADEYKYLAVRRLALYIEESLYRGTKWVVFEPNDEPLWSQIRLNVGAFMHNLFRQGAFQGRSPKEAYFVKCDKESTTQNDINLGIVNIIVGFAPLKPAEFVIIKVQQLPGQIDV